MQYSLFFKTIVYSSFYFQYMSGFDNEFATEDPRCPGALPEGQVSLRKYIECDPLELYESWSVDIEK